MTDKKIKMKVDDSNVGSGTEEVTFPSNSRKHRNTKVITTQAKVQKKSLMSKFVGTFVGEDVEDVSTYVIHDVVIPSVKNMIFDGLETLFFGRPRTGRRGTTGFKKPNPGGYVSYNTINQNPIEPPRSVQPRAAHLFSDIVIASRPDAEAVIMLLADLLDDYGEASVADLYTAVDITPQYTDHNYGWTNLSTASVKRVRHGYLLNLPKPELLA